MSDEIGYIVTASTPELEENRRQNGGMLTKEFFMKASTVIQANEAKLKSLVAEYDGAVSQLSRTQLGVWVPKHKSGLFDRDARLKDLPFNINKDDGPKAKLL